MATKAKNKPMTKEHGKASYPYYMIVMGPTLTKQTDEIIKSMETKCDQCNKPTDNEFRSCAGAEAEERAQNCSPVDLCKGLPTCNCCDPCRLDCHNSWMEENEPQSSHKPLKAPNT